MQHAQSHTHKNGPADQSGCRFQRLRRTVGVVAALMFGLGAASVGIFSAAHAQTLGSKPVRLIAPYPAGGGVDFLSRVLQPELQRLLNTTVIVENRPGATGVIGTRAAAQSPPDGHTMVVGNLQTISMVPILSPELNFAPMTELAPVSLAVNVDYFLVVRASLPVKTFQELIAYAKANPGKLSYASSGEGSLSHLATEILCKAAGIEMTHVPYKGNGQVQADLLGGQVDLIIGDLVSFLPFVESRRLRALASTGSTRAALLPDLPTVAELGFPNYSAAAWQGILVPFATPPEIVKLLNAKIVEALKTPAVSKTLTSKGQTPVGSSPEDFAKLIKADSGKWAQAVKEINLGKRSN